MNAERRFWGNVLKGLGCWEWQRSTGSHGYGQFYPRKSAPVLAHRYSWEITNGPIQDGLHVLHHCDNKKCVRPDHLFLGTPADNAADKCSKGRQSRFALKGNASPCAKISDLDAANIRARLKIGTRQNAGNASEIASEYGITRTRVYQIGRGART